MSRQVVNVGQIEIRYLVDGAQSGGLGLFEMKVPAGTQVPPPHSHTDSEECVYVLEGVLRYSVDDETRDLRPGDWMSTPRGSVHQFSNPGSETARPLVMLTPDIGEQYFRDVGAVANAGGPPDRAKLMEVMIRYGLVFAAPKQVPRAVKPLLVATLGPIVDRPGSTGCFAAESIRCPSPLRRRIMVAIAGRLSARLETD